MGLRVRLSRTLAAALLTALALAIPCAAWFVVGSRAVEREARLEEAELQQQAYERGVRWSHRLADRLATLWATESRRPFYHYQNLYHDPQVAAEGTAISISPLASGPADPWIETYFQVDAVGRLTLPTLNDEFPELGLSDPTAQCELLMRLENVALVCAGGPGVGPGASCSERLESTATTTAGSATADIGGVTRGAPARVEVLTPRAWWQHLEANALYADLRDLQRSAASATAAGGDGARVRVGSSRHQPGGTGPGRGLGRGEPGQGWRQRTAGAEAKPEPAIVQIVVGPFNWHTIPVGDAPGLVALRDVQTPVGRWTQGFLIKAVAIAQTLEEGPYPAAFVPLTESGPAAAGTVIVPVEGTPWGVALDLARETATIRAAADLRQDRFLRVFILGALGASLAGGLVVAMVYQAERLAEQRSRFAASAAHELRTPLAGLRLYGEMLAEGLGDLTRTRDYARRVAGEAERLGRVVTNVLSFTRLERQTLKLHLEPGDLGDAVTQEVSRQRLTLEEAGTELTLAVQADLPPVRFDRDALAHILQNLLDNAEKYTRGQDPRYIRVSLTAVPQGVALTVADNGPGVAKPLRRRLFRAFARGEHGAVAEGLGLGLVLVKALVTAHGGTITYCDAPHGGAVFTVTLPCGSAPGRVVPSVSEQTVPVRS